MKITIDYEASWRNSFLDGSNNEPLPRKGRNFVASMTELKKPENHLPREITKSTVMGLLSRLIGDQRKLYQAKSSDQYYFADLEELISFEDKPEIINHEMIYLRNIKGSTDQNSFTGMIKVNSPIFTSDYSSEFWGVLALDLDELCAFILNDFKITKLISLDPVSILHQLENIKLIKPRQYEGVLKEASQALSETFDKFKPLNNKGEQVILPMYCSALYLQLKRLANRYDISSAKTKAGGISGISNNGFTPKDFMSVYVTGKKKIIYGNPYLKEEPIKGKGKIKHTLIKANGKLEINIDVDLDKARELKTMIEDAGVSSFYLGKKGLAYVSDIRLH